MARRIGRAIATRHLYLYTGTVNSHLWATERSPKWPPNTIGRYRNCDPILTNHLVRLAVEGRGDNYYQFPQKHLFDRIGVRRFVAEADPLGNFLARRLVILAAEDIGLANPGALPVAVGAQQAVHFIGLPEGRIPLAEATV